MRGIWKRRASSHGLCVLRSDTSAKVRSAIFQPMDSRSRSGSLLIGRFWRSQMRSAGNVLGRSCETESGCKKWLLSSLVPVDRKKYYHSI